jgi:hypothetical protein
MVRNWYRTDSTSTSFGILLNPTGSSTLIRGFQAFIDGDTTFKFQPELHVSARSTVNGVSVFDTLRVGADTYVANVDPFVINPQRIYSQAGIAYRSKMRFDISKLPEGAIINSAELLLERDSVLTNVSRFTSSSQPSVHALTDNDSTKFESLSATGAVKSGTSHTYSFDVRRQVQLWTNGANFGLILRQPNTNEYGTLDLFAFYSREATNAAQRPRILVKYTVFQN